MIKKNENNTDAAAVAVQTHQQSESAASQHLTAPADTVLAAAAEAKWSIQAVAVPNKRRMRAGRLFTETPVTVTRSEFSEYEWNAIKNDPHLKLIPLDE